MRSRGNALGKDVVRLALLLARRVLLQAVLPIPIVDLALLRIREGLVRCSGGTKSGEV